MTMTIGSAFAHLRLRLQALDDVVRQLALAIDDAPDDADEPAVVESLRGETAEIEGEVAAAIRAAAGDARPAHAAAECQRRVNRVWHALQREIGSHHALAEVERVAAERGGAWIRWSGVAREGVERCEQNVFEAADALAACWGEIVERDPIEVGRA
jgi:hypothetical protein